MPAWINITLADLNDARVGKLVEALRTKALADEQTDPMPRVITSVAHEVRDCIAFGGTTLSATVDSIPPGLKDLVVQKVVRALKARLLMALTTEEQEAERLYQRRLEQLTRGDWPVDTPSDPIETPPLPPAAGYFGSAEKVSL